MPADNGLVDELRSLIEEARLQTAQAVNSALTLTKWQVGDRIRRESLQEKRAEYGEEIVATVSRELAAEFGSGFSKSNLLRMIQFAELFPDQEIVVTIELERFR
ncbi:MAG: hypothetical protein CMJ46_16800 [Planctomyces sp.]|nr:hypothetical protein [Planctomyces sp.]